MYWMAGQEGLIANGSVHAGLRTRLSGDGWDDYEDDSRQVVDSLMLFLCMLIMLRAF